MMPICAGAVVVTSSKAAGVIIAGIGRDVEATPAITEKAGRAKRITPQSPC